MQTGYEGVKNTTETEVVYSISFWNVDEWRYGSKQKVTFQHCW